MIRSIVLVTLSFLFAANILIQVGCSSGSGQGSFKKTDAYAPYEATPEDSVIVTKDGTYVGPTDAIYKDDSIAVGEETLKMKEGKFCSDENAKMDVIVVDGEVVETVCYPVQTDKSSDNSKENPTTLVTTQKGDINIPKNANNTVVLFDEETDNHTIDGDVTVNGENVTIYGNGSDKTIIDGNLEITGNNARVRGVTVTGNVSITHNNTAFLFSVVEGNLTISDNNVTVAATDVFGDMTVTGNNAVLVQNRVQGSWDIQGSGPQCDGNYSFTDKNEDLSVSSSEIGSKELTCK
jgi:hypothetical protein